MKPVRLRTGVVIQGGIGARTRQPSPVAPTKPPFRAVVVATRQIDEAGNVRQLSVECDVILVRTNLRLNSVPVLQRQHGVNNADALWIPRPTTRNVLDPSEPLNFAGAYSRRGTYRGKVTSLGNVDGDHVLVDFIEGNPEWPIIVGALPHEQSNRLVRTGAGWREGESETRGNPRPDERYVHHHGAEYRINERGDVLIDTVGAYQDPTTEDASAEGGQVRIRVKDGERFTVAMGDDVDVIEVYLEDGQVRIDLGEGADERVVLGDGFRAFLNGFLEKYRNHTHPTGVGPSGVPSGLVEDMGEDLLSDLAKVRKS